MKQLTIKELACYLPYEIKGQYRVEEVTDNMPSEKRDKILRPDCIDFFLKYCKPYLLPLDYLTKEIEHNGERFVPIDELEKYIDGSQVMEEDLEHIRDFSEKPHEINWEQIGYCFIVKLFEWHFDLHNLIPQNLALDKTK